MQGWVTLGENLGEKGLTTVNLDQCVGLEKDGAIIMERLDVDLF